MSSTDETPRPGEEKFQDFDFFDSDTDNKPVGKLPSNVKPSSANHSKKGRQEDDLHDQGVKRNSFAENQRQGSTEKEELVTKPKTYTSNVRLEMKQTIHKKRETISVAENNERVTIHLPHERSFQDSESDYDSSSSVTDVSPLQSPDATPRARRKNGESSSKHSEKKHLGKTKFVIKESGTQKNEERPHARRSNGETLSVEDLFHSSDATPVSSGEQDIEAEGRRKVHRKKKNRHDEIQHRMEASSRHHRRRLLDVAAQNSMDISQLLEVVLEMEQEEKSRRMYASNRIPRNAGPPPRPMSKRNLSFSNEQVRDIDKENERLLKRLSQLCANSQHARPSSASSVRSVASSVRSSASSNRSSRRPITATGMRSSPSRGPRLYHSATNRLHDQQRIERDNLAFLKRLQTTRASSSLKRDNLLRDYHRQTGRNVEPMRPRRKQKSEYSHREANYDGRPVWQD